MSTSTRQILCEIIRADVGIRPYDADFNTSLNYNLKKRIWASYSQIIIKICISDSRNRLWALN